MSERRGKTYVPLRLDCDHFLTTMTAHKCVLLQMFAEEEGCGTKTSRHQNQFNEISMKNPFAFYSLFFFRLTFCLTIILRIFFLSCPVWIQHCIGSCEALSIYCGKSTFKAQATVTVSGMWLFRLFPELCFCLSGLLQRLSREKPEHITSLHVSQWMGWLHSFLVLLTFHLECQDNW